jgi:hypothetical protein
MPPYFIRSSDWLRENNVTHYPFASLEAVSPVWFHSPRLLPARLGLRRFSWTSWLLPGTDTGAYKLALVCTDAACMAAGHR